MNADWGHYTILWHLTNCTGSEYTILILNISNFFNPNNLVLNYERLAVIPTLLPMGPSWTLIAHLAQFQTLGGV